MIFNRFSRAIIEQNWLTVTLEIFVVVIGIFLGLQVDDWNENRKNQKEELVYLAKLSDDLNTMRIELLDEIQTRTNRLERMKSALYALEDCDNSPQAQADVKFALERYQISNGINFLDATYNEMVASGALARIADQELKQSITYTYSALGRVNSSILSFRVSLPVVDGIVWKNVSYSVDSDGRLTAAFDIEEICENVELRNAFAEMVDIQRDGIGAEVDILPMVSELITRLASVISQSA
jgi:hypothetical protein